MQKFDPQIFFVMNMVFFPILSDSKFGKIIWGKKIQMFLQNEQNLHRKEIFPRN